MTQEKIKVVVDIRGGLVQSVYAGSLANPLIEVVVIDNDHAEIQNSNEDFSLLPLHDFNSIDFRTYDGKFPRSWGNWK